MAPKTHRIQSIPHSHAQRWLLAHDIRDKRRLQRVWRFLRQEGVRLQYSVYLLAGTRQHVENIINRLKTYQKAPWATCVFAISASKCQRRVGNLAARNTAPLRTHIRA